MQMHEGGGGEGGRIANVSLGGKGAPFAKGSTIGGANKGPCRKGPRTPASLDACIWHAYLIACL